MKPTLTLSHILPWYIKMAFCSGFIRIAYVLALCMVLSFPGEGKETISSLKANLQFAHTDSARLKVYQQIFQLYQYSNPDSAIFYMKEGLAQFTTSNYRRGMAEMLNEMAGIYATLSLLDAAKQTANTALSIFTETNNTPGIASANNVLGVIEGRKGNYSDAESHFFVALKLFEQLNDSVGITDTYIKLGVATAFMNNDDKALEYYKKGLAYLPGKQVSDVSIYLNNNIGAEYLAKNDNKNALKYLQLSLKQSLDPQYSEIRLLPLVNVGEVYVKEGDTMKGMNYLQQALAIAERQNLREDITNILEHIAQITSDHEKALAILDSAYKTAKAIKQKKLQTDILTDIIELYKNKGDYKQAYQLLETKKNLSDSIFSIDNSRNIANMEALYNLDKLNAKVQDLEVTQQKQQTRVRITLMVALLIATLLIIIFVFYLRTRLLNVELNKREESLKRSNEVKNKLISIIAHDLIGAIGFMPLALRLCKDPNIPAVEKEVVLNELELNATASYDTMQNMLDWGKAQIQGIILNQSLLNAAEITDEVLTLISITAAHKNIKIENKIIPGTTIFADPDHYRFIIRNLLSNAVKFSPENGQIEVYNQPADEDGQVTFSVRDTGSGIPKNIIDNVFEAGTMSIGSNGEKGNGIGLKLCKEFALENGGKIWVSSVPGKGSVFFFSLNADISRKN